MPFTDIALQWPHGAADGADAALPVLDSGRQGVDQAKSRADQVPALAYVPSTVTPGAVAMAAHWQSWYEFLDAGGQTLCVHPWQEGVGHGYGLHKTLSAKNALQAIANKLRDKNDAGRPSGTTELVVIMLPAPTLDDLANALQSFCSGFPVPELAAVQRLALRMGTYDQDHEHRPEPLLNPHWRDRRCLSHGAARIANQAVGAALATAMGYAVDTDPLAELKSLADKKAQYIDQVQQDLDNARALFTGGAGRAFFVSAGSPELCADALTDADDFTHADVYTAGLALTAPTGQLAFVKEALNP